MVISYNKLWKLLIDRKMSKAIGDVVDIFPKCQEEKKGRKTQ